MTTRSLWLYLPVFVAGVAGCADLRNDAAATDGGAGGAPADGRLDRANQGASTTGDGGGAAGGGGAGTGGGGTGGMAGLAGAPGASGAGGAGAGGDPGGAGGAGGVAPGGASGGAGTGGMGGTAGGMGGAAGGMGGAGSAVMHSLTLRVMARGKATGSVKLSSPAMTCASECTAMLAAGTPVTLTAEPAPGFWLEGWTGACAAQTGAACTLTLTSNQLATAIFTPANTVFVTSTTRVVSALGGVAGADAICLERARAASLAGQTWKAWLATASVSPRLRFASARGWVRPDGKPFADKLEDLTDQTSRGLVWFYPPKLDENGTEVSKGNIASCAASGEFFCKGSPVCGPDGQEYTANAGSMCWGQTDHSWELAGTCGDGCGQAMHLLCLGTDFKAQVTLPPAPAGAKIVFVGPVLKGNATVAGADALCAAEARNANLPGTFLALITPTGVSAASRFTASAGPYHRPDGLPVAATANDLFSGRIQAPILQSASGRYISGTNDALTGGMSPFEVGVDASNCRNWTSNAAADRIVTGAPMGTGTNFFNHGLNNCAIDYYWMLCMQK